MHEELFVSEFLFTQFSLTIVLQELLQCHLNVLFSIISSSKTNNQALHYFYLFIYLPRISYMLSSEIYSIYTCSMMVYTSQMSHVDRVCSSIFYHHHHHMLSIYLPITQMSAINQSGYPMEMGHTLYILFSFF